LHDVTGMGPGTLPFWLRAFSVQKAITVKPNCHLYCRGCITNELW